MIRTKITRDKCLIPELHQLGWAVFDKPVRDEENLPEHIHSQAYEICYIVHGSVDWYVENEAFQVSAGNIFITFPGEKHGGTHDIMNPCELYWLQLNISADHNFVGISREDSIHLARAFSDIDRRIFPASSNIENLYKKIISEHDNTTLFSKSIVQVVLVELAVEIIRSYNVHAAQHKKRNITKEISLAVKLIDDGFTYDLKFDDIAKQVGLSSTAFFQQFAEQIHMSPGEYLTYKRMQKAKELLTDSTISITEIGHRLGYSSSQYFSTLFKKHAGVTPREFRDAEK